MVHTESEVVQSGTSAVRKLAVYFDPLCPWTWKTSTWLFNVQELTDLEIDWRFYSLTEANGGNEAMTIPLRLLDHARHTGGNEAVKRTYRALGKAIHDSNRDLAGAGFEEVMRGAAHEAGLDDGALDEALENRRTLRDVESETDEAMNRFSAYGSPWLVADNRPFGFNGPIITHAPEGRRALDLWTHVSYLLTCEEFYEIKRERE